jgi:penicillin-binding protein 2
MSVHNQARSRVVQIIFIAVFVVIIGQLLNLQLVSSNYRLQAENNARFRKVVYPDRGIVFDRKKRAVLENTIMYDLVFTPSEIKGTDTLSLCSILGIDTAEFKKRVVEAIIKNSRVRPSVFEPLLTPQMFARLNENMYKFPGFILLDRPVRSYPYDAAAHILGYLGEVDTSFLRKHIDEGYEMGDYAGLTGIERSYEKVLMGQRGIEYFIRDNRSRLQGKYEAGVYDTTPVAGRNLYTSLDIEVQQLAEKLLENKIGSAVAINPKTGGIIAMASTPGYKPSELTGPDRRKNFSRLFLDTAAPLLNRAIKGQYPPGSTFKPLGGLIALDERLITPSYGYGCGGVYYACGIGKPKCTHNTPGHARNLRVALANSCNSYFTQVFRMAIDNPKYKNAQGGYLKWKEYMNSFGLGVRLGVDLPSEDKGNIPDTAAYNRDFGGFARWNSCNILTLGIGQDRMTATPLQLANMMCGIANKGYYFTPHVVDSIENETEEDTVYTARFRRKHSVTNIPDSAYEAIHMGMQDVTIYGTAIAAQIPGINICAKTGTAQNPHGDEHSIFVAFAPRENPRIAIAVVVENAGFGSTWAAPIASLMMEKYLKDTLTAERQIEVERISKADLIPSAIRKWYRMKDSIRQAKLALIESNVPKMKNNIENRKVTYDPEAEPNRKDSEKRDSTQQTFTLPVTRRKKK